MPLSQTLIKSALKLTGEVMSEMEEDETYDYVTVGIFSYPKFFYYLFSENFIEKYALIAYEWSDDTYKYRASQSIGQSIYEYQKGNHEPLERLLSKI